MPALFIHGNTGILQGNLLGLQSGWFFSYNKASSVTTAIQTIQHPINPYKKTEKFA